MFRSTALLVVFSVSLPLSLLSAQSEDNYTMALTGDSIITRKLSVYEEPEYLSMIERIRAADVAFTNIEILFHDYEYYPMASSGGTYMRADPMMAKELAWAGFDLGSLANNHSGDYGPPAMLNTERVVRDAGIVAAGTGKSLSEAREAKFLETGKARIALISVASTFPGHSMAGASRDDVPARPGLNPLRYETTYHLPPSNLQQLRDIAKSLEMRVSDDSDSLRFFRQQFVSSETAKMTTKPNQADVDAIAAVVNNASRLADYVILTIHAHEGPNRMEPADFVVTFAHAMIEAGVDVFVGHGPHALRAIEIYKGKPIFYSLGDFVFQNETLQRLPYENYARYGLDEAKGLADFNAARYNNDTTGFPAEDVIWESVVAEVQWQGQELAGIDLYPISLGYGEPNIVRGRPMYADAELSKKIISDLQRISKPYGTDIVFEDGIGKLRPLTKSTRAPQ